MKTRQRKSVLSTILFVAGCVCGGLSVFGAADSAFVSVSGAGIYKCEISDGVWSAPRKVATDLLGDAGNPTAVDIVNGVVYVSTGWTKINNSSRIYKLDLDGNVLGELRATAYVPENFAHSSDGRYLYAVTSNPDGVHRIDLATGADEELIPKTGWTDTDGNPVEGTLNKSRQLAINARGELVVMSRDGNTIQAFNAAGRFLWGASVGSNYKGGIVYDSVRNYYWLPYGAQGASRFSDNGDGTVSKVSGDLSLSGERNCFSGVAFDGDLFFGGYDAKCVFFYPAGAETRMTEQAATFNGAVHALAVCNRAETLRQSAGAVGTLVATESATVRAVGAPSMVKVTDGLLLARDTGAADNTTVVYRSTDGGTTWTTVVTNAAISSATLFTVGDKVYLLGVDATAGALKIGVSSDGGETWGFAPAGGIAGVTLGAGAVCEWNGRIWKGAQSVSGGLCVVSAAVAADGTLSDWTKSADLVMTFGDQISPFGAVAPGALAVNPSGDGLVFLAPFTRMLAETDWETSCSAEAAAFLAVTDKSAAPVGSTSTVVMIPGACKPFNVLFDAVSGRYWAALTAAHLPQDLALGASTAADIRHRVSLYSSLTLCDWAFHADITTGAAGQVALDAPSLAVDGDSLVVAYAAAVGGDTADRLLFTRRVENFRAIKRDKKTPGRLLVANPKENNILRYYRNSLGEWCADGVFADSANGEPLSNLGSLVACGRKVFAAQTWGNVGTCKVFEFNRQGVFRRVVGTFNPTANSSKRIDFITASPDGQWIYISESADDACTQIWRMRVADGTVELFVAHTGWGGTFVKARGMACDAAGRLYVCDRNANAVYRFTSEGILDETHTLNAAQSVVVDDAAGTVLMVASNGYACQVEIENFATTSNPTVLSRIWSNSNYIAPVVIDGVPFACNYLAGTVETPKAAGSSAGYAALTLGNNGMGICWLPDGGSVAPDVFAHPLIIILR